jgi:hypothetical protein
MVNVDFVIKVYFKIALALNILLNNKRFKLIKIIHNI